MLAWSLDQNFLKVCWSWFLCVAAHPIQTFASFAALIVATPAVSFVGHWVHTLPFAANLWVFTLLTTHPAVEPVCLHVHAFLLAAIRPRTARYTADSGVLVTCHHGPRFLSKKPACSSERSWLFLAVCRREKIISYFACIIVIVNEWFFFRWCCGGESDSQGHEQDQHQENFDKFHGFLRLGSIIFGCGARIEQSKGIYRQEFLDASHVEKVNELHELVFVDTVISGMVQFNGMHKIMK